MSMGFGSIREDDYENRFWIPWGWIAYYIFEPMGQAVKLIFAWAFTTGPRERKALRLLYREGMPYVYRECLRNDGKIVMHRWAPKLRLPGGYRWL